MIRQEAFIQETALSMAPKLLGCHLVRANKNSSEGIEGIITCVEAYCGVTDRACHGFRGKVTKRNKVMFEKGGCWYVYLCYGLHWMLNLVVGQENDPQAILIREIAIKTDDNRISLISGPGRVTKYFGITGQLNSQLVNQELKIVPNLFVNIPSIKTAPRIGIEYAGKDKNKPWRFFLENPDAAIQLPPAFS